MSHLVICALYKFVTLNNYRAIQKPLLSLMLEHGIRGTILLAQEGINGTVAADRNNMDHLLAFLKSDARLADLSYKESYTNQPPFLRSRVKLKKEIVTMGIEGIDPKRVVGTYVKPTDWNALIKDPDVLLVDTRNDYEVQVGTFKDALNPKTESFRDFPGYVKEKLDAKKHPKVAMFCTGGIRCEKSTAYLKEQGFDEVYHLKGGILKYLEEVPAEESLWEGECFVFDDRVTVNHQLEKGVYEQCNACRMPITAKEQLSNQFQQGVSCPHCFENTTEQQKARFAEREKQMSLAQQRGESHIGTDTAKVIAQNRLKKQKHFQQQRSASLKKTS